METTAGTEPCLAIMGTHMAFGQGILIHTGSNCLEHVASVRSNGMRVG